MNRLLKTVSALLVALSMVALPVTAQSRSGRQSHFSSSQSHGDANKHRPSGGNNGGGQKPGNNGSHRPGGNNGNSGHRPGGNNGHNPGNNPGQRPNNGHNPGGQRPPAGPNPSVRPGRPTPPPPPAPHPGGYRPQRPPYIAPGHHNHRIPFLSSFHRPVPPPAWRPVPHRGPSFGTILGIALGSTVDLSLNALLNYGYNVTGYNNNVVYLTNVPQMNYYWPDAALYYNNGILAGSTFTYPTTVYDMSRYNALYNTFYAQYGAPVSVANNGGVVSATWFGNGNRYVSLEFNSNYGNYYTTLSFGL